MKYSNLLGDKRIMRRHIELYSTKPEMEHNFNNELRSIPNTTKVNCIEYTIIDDEVIRIFTYVDRIDRFKAMRIDSVNYHDAEPNEENELLLMELMNG